MPISRFLITAAFIAFSAPFAVAARADAASESHEKSCVLGLFKVTQIGSLYVTEHAGQGSYQRFAGARLFLAAQPGLTPEWIQANLKLHAENKKRSVSPECPLDVPGASASVSSAGTGFWVDIQAKEPAASKEILNRSRHPLQ